MALGIQLGKHRSIHLGKHRGLLKGSGSSAMMTGQVVKGYGPSRHSKTESHVATKHVGAKKTPLKFRF